MTQLDAYEAEVLAAFDQGALNRWHKPGWPNLGPQPAPPR